MSRDSGLFSPLVLLHALSSLPARQRLLVGFSGGADSTALLLALQQLAEQLPGRITAVHFNHGLQAEAGHWEDHCRQFCQQLRIELQVHHLSLQPHPASSPETLAREARYAVIRELLEPRDIYLTAHQADDQAETVLLNLLRGSGAAGLAGIQPLRRFARGWLARPLLEVRRFALEAWLDSQQVSWIRDASNQDETMDRNFLRSRIMPQLDRRWPGIVARLQQTAEHLQQGSSAFEELLSQFPVYCSADGFTLRLDGFMQASRCLQAEIIRHWAQQREAPPPPRARLEEFLAQLQHANSESHTELIWRNWLIRHHAGRLWMHAQPPPGPCPETIWGDEDTLELGSLHGQLRWVDMPAELHNKAMVCSRMRVSSNANFRKSVNRKIKEIMRISFVPDWLRDAIPLLLVNGELGAIGDWWYSPLLKRQWGLNHRQYTWKVEDPLLQQVQSVCHNSAVDPDITLV